ncbi:hypothetical protein Nepgr_016832 [Nepenthes gracilis]|uniref:Remorin C-terminal domain-containing protein n=1 Tax=Nepenthes gracilis TaxID=150966 RepID=A0AAD3SRD7_NEPGR|nr:hypothetical protein Nepgr_016832 [Nepenthes gracilis]
MRINVTGSSTTAPTPTLAQLVTKQLKNLSTERLMGEEKKRRKAEAMESASFLRSSVSEIGERGCLSSETCKDVDVVSELPEYFTSKTAYSKIITHRIMNDQSLIDQRTTPYEEYEVDYARGHDNISVSSSPFEFQKAERGPQRVPIAPFSKAAPSKWDDAKKWISSPNSNRPKTMQTPVGQGARKPSSFSSGSRQSSTFVVEALNQRSAYFEEPDAKQVDSSEVKMENGSNKIDCWESAPVPIIDSYGKPLFFIEKSVGEPTSSLSQQDSSVSIQTATAFIPPPSSARSISMRDMGTEMTPIASQEPSRIGTPVKVMSPMHSPTSSRPSSPKRAPISKATLDYEHLELNRKELSEKDIHMRTRREIMVLGTQLGKMNIAAWASQEEDKGASTSLKNVIDEKLPKKGVFEARANAWEEAEKAKYMARFEREEMQIQAWENHQKAKMEAEMRKIEVEVERMRARVQDRLMNKFAAAKHKAEEKRAAAEFRREKQVAKAEQQAEYIRKTGWIPSKFSCWNWCC